MNYVDFVNRFIADNFSSQYYGFRWIKTSHKDIDLTDDRINAFVNQLIADPHFSLSNTLFSGITIADVLELPAIKRALIFEVFTSYRHGMKDTSVKIIAKDGVEIEVPRKFFSKIYKEGLKPNDIIRLPNVSAEVIRKLLKEFCGGKFDLAFIKNHALEILELEDIYRNIPLYINCIATRCSIEKSSLESNLFKACLKLSSNYPHIREMVNSRLSSIFDIDDKISVECDWELGEIYVNLDRIDNDSLEKLKQALSVFEVIYLQVLDENADGFPALLALIASANSIRSIQLDHPLRTHFQNFLNWFRNNTSTTEVHICLSKNGFQTPKAEVEALLETLEHRTTVSNVEVTGSNYLPAELRKLLYFGERALHHELHSLLLNGADISPPIKTLFDEFKAAVTSTPRKIESIIDRLNGLLTIDILRSSPDTLRAYRDLVTLYPDLGTPVEIAAISVQTVPPHKRKAHQVDKRLAALTFPFTLDNVGKGLYYIEEPYIIDKIVRFISTGEIDFANFDDAVQFFEVALEIHLDVNFIDECLAAIQRYISEAETLLDVLEYYAKLRNFKNPRLISLLSKNHRIWIHDKPVLWSIDKKGGFHLHFSEMPLGVFIKIRELINRNAIASCHIHSAIQASVLGLLQKIHLIEKPLPRLILSSAAAADLSGLNPSFIKTIESIPPMKQIIEEFKEFDREDRRM